MLGRELGVCETGGNRRTEEESSACKRGKPEGRRESGDGTEESVGRPEVDERGKE